MKINADDLLNSIIASLDRVQFISSEDIPNIDLYMDQVTTFMDSRLRNTVRDEAEDKVLTKTMINNYAKNNLLPPPVKKKYSREHVLLLIFIYYFKNILSINDIQRMLNPMAERYFGKDGGFGVKEIYEQVIAMEPDQIENLKKDIIDKYNSASEDFQEIEGEEQEFLQTFSFICKLSFDVYIKKLMIEKILDEYYRKQGGTGEGGKKEETKKQDSKKDAKKAATKKEK